MIQLTHNIVNQPYPNIKLKIKKDLQSFLLWLLTTVTKISLIILHFYLQCHLKYSRTMLERKQIVCDILREACKSKYYFSPHSKDLLDTQSQNFVWALSFPLTVTWVLCMNQLYFISRKKKNHFAYLSEGQGRKPYQFFCTFPWFFLYQIQLIFFNE